MISLLPLWAFMASSRVKFTVHSEIKHVEAGSNKIASNRYMNSNGHNYQTVHSSGMLLTYLLHGAESFLRS